MYKILLPLLFNLMHSHNQYPPGQFLLPPLNVKKEYFDRLLQISGAKLSGFNSYGFAYSSGSKWMSANLMRIAVPDGKIEVPIMNEL